MKGPGGPLLRPYPNWSWHNSNHMCDGMVNVLRVNIRCNHIFVLDSGKIGPDYICNPKLLIFNLKDDTLVKTIYIPFDIANNATGFGLLLEPFVYVPKKCKQFLHKMIVFMTDLQGKGLVVYDSSVKSMCRVESDYMIPTSNFSSIANQKFRFDGGIFSTVILYDELYYVTTPGTKIYKIKIKSLLKCPNIKEANKKTKVAIKIPSNSGQIASAGHSIFYSDADGNAILGTNVFQKSGKNTVILAQDDKKLQSISSLKASYHWNKLIGLSDRYHRYALGTVNLNEVNIRYFEMDLAKIRKKMDATVKMKYSLCILIILSTAIVSFGVELNVVHEWKYCEYEWKNQQQKENAINSKSYDPYLCFFFDAIKADDGRVFISTPKYFDHGVPASLATVTNATGPGGPLLRPYPDWSWHNNTSCMCDGIVNVHRIYIKCNHIFVLDSGEVGLKQICNPKLLIFDLKDDTLVKTIYIPLDMATDEKGIGLLIAPFTYVPGECTQFLDKMIFNHSNITYYMLTTIYKSELFLAKIVISCRNFRKIFLYLFYILELYYSIAAGKEIYKIKLDRLLECPNKEEANKHIELVTKLQSQSVYITSTEHSIFYGNNIGMAILGKNVSKKSVNKNTVFMTDAGDSGLVVYNSFTNSMCRVESDYMKPTDTSCSIAGENFTYVGGIGSITVLDDDFYFAAISGKEIYKIKIKNLLKYPNKEKANKQTQLIKKLSSQTITLTSVGQSIFYSDSRAMSILRMKKSYKYETVRYPYVILYVSI
ncbi:MRJP4 protein, partial [Acromyrmex charruanus]